MSVSRYLAELARWDLESDWPEGYFQRLFGVPASAPIVRGRQNNFETRSIIE